MKTTRLLFVLVITTIALAALGQTNLTTNLTNLPLPMDEPVTPAPITVPEFLKPLFELLGGKGPLLTTLIAWVAAIGVALAPVSGVISRWLRDALNKAASTQAINDDEWLRRLFSNKLYASAAFLLRFVNIDLPTSADLERAIELQKEAVAKAQPANATPPA